MTDAPALELGGLAGLSPEEAASRLLAEGRNELPSESRHGLLALVLEVVREPMFLMLVGAGGLYLSLGELTDALMLLGFVLVVMGITIVQERRTERALEALRDLSSPRALVVRGGKRERIAGRDVVRGDVLVLAEGDRVPADALLRQATNLAVDESLLTGESVPVAKSASATASALDRPGGDGLPSVFSGTLVTAGQGVALVLATGARTELGKIGKALLQVEPEATPLQRETGRLVRTFAVVGLAACALVVVAFALEHGGGRAWKEGLLAGLALAMAILPEEFPVVLTVFLALGAWRISRRQVLTRRMPAVETLGSATVLCTDKTGTLTQNRMCVTHLVPSGARLVPGAATDERSLVEAAVLASRSDPFDPMERAIHEAGERVLGAAHPAAGLALAREWPLTPARLAVTQAWRGAGERPFVVAAKGAPEAIATLCRLAPERRQALLGDVAALAEQGLRVLAVARGTATGELPGDPAALDLELLGIVGLADPLRPAVPAAVAECRTAGIRVVMITGDYPATARTIARQAGIASEPTVLTGPELAEIPDAELAARIARTDVFARVVPEQKLRIVTALKSRGEIVAMTGDGVNDAPALKAAHIGVAMGGRGTDVARESAALVLLDDDFSSIVAAVRLGRRILDNIRKAISFIIAVHVPIAGLSMLPIFFPKWPLLLLPVHIVFLELVIDPSCTLVFEAETEEPDVMTRPPRDPGEKLFAGRAVLHAVAQGLSSLAACIVVYMLARGAHEEGAARALMFTTLVTSFFAIILSNRSRTKTVLASLASPNAALWWLLAGTAAFLALVLGVPFAQRLFRFAPLHPDDLALAVVAGAACGLFAELWKLLPSGRAARPRS